MDNQGQTGGISDADIDATEAWDIINESPNIKIGVIDTGIDWNHPDLTDNIWQNMGEDIDNDGQVIQWDNATSSWIFDPDDENGIDDDNNGYVDDFIGWDFVNDDNNPFDDNGHGTHVAGTIGAEGNNAEGVVGVTWKVQLAALKTFDSQGYGPTSVSIEAIDYARMMGFHLTNNSWGGYYYNQSLYNAIEATHAAGQLFVAAAGNDGDDVEGGGFPLYPAAYDVSNIISVAATNHNDNRAWFSNYGSTLVDLAAPGQGIFSCVPDNSYNSYNGTSMAAPHVSGAVALVWEQCNALDNLAVKDLLLASVDVKADLQGKCVTGGRLNVFNALQMDNGTATFTYGISTLTVNFTPDYTEGNTYTWNFGDGMSSNQMMPTHTYAAGGSYMVELTVENDCASYTHSEIVTLAVPCSASFSIDSNSPANDNAICQGYTGTFTNTTNGATSSEWKINNEVVSTNAVFAYIFDETGPHIISLYTTTANGECSISQEIEIYGNAQNLYLGEDVYTCESSTILDSELPGMAAYFWDFENDPISPANGGGLSSLLAEESGNYRLMVVDHCDQLIIDEIEVSLGNCGNVWPGNANDDGRVDNYDMLTVMSNHTATGPSRVNASTDWLPQAALNWGDIDNDNVDTKHADCDGDGLVDTSNESPIVSSHYGNIVPTNPNDINNNPFLNQDYVLFAERSNIQMSEDETTLTFDLRLHNTTNQPVEISGLAFSAKYRRGANPILNSLNSHLGEEGNNLFTFSHALPGKRIDVAVGRLDGMSLNLPPSSSILITQFILDEHIVIGTPGNPEINMTAVTLNDVVLVDGVGDWIYLGGSSSSSTSGEASGGVTTGGVEPLSVAMMSTHLLDCEVGNTAIALPTGGQSPYTYLWENGATTPSIDDLNPGIYSVTVTDDEGTSIVGQVQVESTIQCNFPNTSLSYNLVEFTAHPQKSSIALNWTTENEIDIQEFAIQRSLDGTHFQTIATRSAKGRTARINNYQWIDNHVETNTTYYYRLHIVDENNNSYSIVQSAQITHEENITWSLNPNPTSAKTTVFLNETPTSPLSLTVYNPLGQPLVQTIYEAENYENQIEIDLSDYIPGVYWIELVQNGQIFTSKIIKQ